MRKYKYLIIISILVFIISIGASYAWFAYQVENTVAIKGNIVAIDADLTVELVVGTNDEMVPMLDDALSNAINGVGSNTPCVDSQGNLSCQVYKITLANNGSRLKNLQGTIELYAKSGSTYNNLKWQELTDTTTIKEGSTPNGMSKSILVSGLTLESKESKSWYVAVWISETDYDQTDTDKGDFGGTVTFEVVNSSGISLYSTIAEAAVMDNIASDYVTTSTGINFGAISSDTNGKGIYIRSGTENDAYPIYYYRGAVDNNNLIFAGFCWKIVRTTETGGTKLIYNGTPTDGTCNNTGTSSQIGTNQFNTSASNSLSSVGYMYGTEYLTLSKTMSNITDTYYYGNDVSYDEETGKYTLIDTISSADWSSIYSTGLNNYHYTCFSASETCDNENGEVYYIHSTRSVEAFYITLTSGKKVEDALEEMLDYNATSSTIKGDKDTDGTLDNWYYTNIENTEAKYGDYVEDTIWCNDRSIYSLGGFDPDGGDMSTTTEATLWFAAYEKFLTGVPKLICSRDIDKFTTDTNNGNGDLDYPVGLLTIDEVMLAGGALGTTSTYYLYTGKNYWGNSPLYFGYDGDPVPVVSVFSVSSSGQLSFNGSYSYNGVRPSISLKAGFNITEGGTGTTDNPYIVS